MGEARRRKNSAAGGSGWRLQPVREPKPLRELMIPATAAGIVSDAMLRYLVALAEEIRGMARAALAEVAAEGTRAALDRAVRKIGEESAAALDRQIARHRESLAAFAADLAAVQCRSGCSYCCHFNVEATVLEVLRMAAEQAAGTNPDRRAAIAETAPRLAGIDREARRRTGIPCPLLVDGACSAYAARPLACRSLLSLDAAACAADFSQGREGGERRAVPSLSLLMLLGMAILSGQVAALNDFRLASHMVELTAALALLDREPAAVERWLAGEDVFARTG
jgi:Putative zinc- or iron-chelating domain